MPQAGYSFQAGGQPGFYIPTVPPNQRPFIAQSVNQITRPRWQTQTQVQQIAANNTPYPSHVNQIRAGTAPSRPPRHQGAPNIARRDAAPYQPGMGARTIPSQQVPLRSNVPAVSQQRAPYKYTANTRNQYPAGQMMVQGQPEQAAAIIQVLVLNQFCINL